MVSMVSMVNNVRQPVHTMLQTWYNIIIINTQLIAGLEAFNDLYQ